MGKLIVIIESEKYPTKQLKEEFDCWLDDSTWDLEVQFTVRAIDPVNIPLAEAVDKALSLGSAYHQVVIKVEDTIAKMVEERRG